MRHLDTTTTAPAKTAPTSTGSSTKPKNQISTGGAVDPDDILKGAGNFRYASTAEMLAEW